MKKTEYFMGIPMEANKSVFQCLKKVQGVGNKTLKKICSETGILPSTPWKILDDDQILTLLRWFENQKVDTTDKLSTLGKFGQELVKVKKENRSYLISLGSVRGIRLRQGLPVRGQNTQCNAKTSKRSRH